MSQTIFRFFQVASFCVFAGRSYQHLFHDAPFRTLLWNEGVMRGFVEGSLGMAWTDYVRSPVVDAFIQNSITSFGWWYLALAILVVFIEYVPKWATKLLWLGSFSLVFLASLYMLEKFNHIG